MKPGKVIGHIVASAKYSSLEGKKMLLIQPTDWNQEPKGDAFVALDACGAGYDEFIFYVEAREAAVAFKDLPPVDAACLGIIDGVNIDK